MHRKTLNASRLQEEVKRRLQRLQEVVEDGVKIVVPRPQAQEPDRAGCNWTMRHFGNAAGFESSIARVLTQVQAEYNLAAEADAADEAEANAAPSARVDPFGGTHRQASENPFGETSRAPQANPFGEKKPAKAGDPFGAQRDESAESTESETPRKRPANPFGD
jgi:hypothetical protein